MWDLVLYLGITLAGYVAGDIAKRKNMGVEEPTLYRPADYRSSNIGGVGKRLGDNIDSGLIPEDFQVVAGKTTQVAYSPDAACGSSAFTAANQATAGLYAYTPYQPNAAAAAGGDECTSWGNWNFYGYFRRFFGDPTPST